MTSFDCLVVTKWAGRRSWLITFGARLAPRDALAFVLLLPHSKTARRVSKKRLAGWPIGKSSRRATSETGRRATMENARTFARHNRAILLE